MIDCIYRILRRIGNISVIDQLKVIEYIGYHAFFKTLFRILKELFLYHHRATIYVRDKMIFMESESCVHIYVFSSRHPGNAIHFNLLVKHTKSISQTYFSFPIP